MKPIMLFIMILLMVSCKAPLKKSKICDARWHTRKVIIDPQTHTCRFVNWSTGEQYLTLDAEECTESRHTIMISGGIYHPKSNRSRYTSLIAGVRLNRVKKQNGLLEIQETLAVSDSLGNFKLRLKNKPGEYIVVVQNDTVGFCYSLYGW